ncbi:hypothetical protein EI94DRAFT_1708410 [Lactarius quietus]|nr:hypothetical protein EI94DRAFT_1708410 [Lactarius quietus]
MASSVQQSNVRLRGKNRHHAFPRCHGNPTIIPGPIEVPEKADVLAKDNHDRATTVIVERGQEHHKLQCGRTVKGSDSGVDGISEMMRTRAAIGMQMYKMKGHGVDNADFPHPAQTGNSSLTACFSTIVATAYDTLGESDLEHSLNEPECPQQCSVYPTRDRVIFDGQPNEEVLARINVAHEGVTVVSLDALRDMGRAEPLEVAESCIPSANDSSVSSTLSGLCSGSARVKMLTDPSVRNCQSDIKAFRPTIMLGVPAKYETICKGILAQVHKSGAVRERTGGRMRLAFSGGAALSHQVPRRTRGQILSTNNPPSGDVLPPSPPIIDGYYKRDDLNNDESIFTKDGWFRPGDVRVWNKVGTLSLVYCIKNLVKLQGGEYIVLKRLESTYKSCNIVSDLCVYANSETTQPIAIIVPHEMHLRAVLTKENPQAPLATLCKSAKSIEFLRAVVITPDEWTSESGLVTAAQKIQKRKISAQFEAEIKEGYGVRK